MSEYDRMFKEASVVNSPTRVMKGFKGNNCHQVVPKNAGVVGESKNKCPKCYNNLGDLIY